MRGALHALPCAGRRHRLRLVKPRQFYHRESNGIRVTVRPRYLREQSYPFHQHYVFAYAVRIENIGEAAAQLRSRRWLIHDSSGEDTEVIGEGVVGETPTLGPGDVHEYQSFCVLKTPAGSMEGQYHFSRADGSGFAAEIPRFQLEVENGWSGA